MLSFQVESTRDITNPGLSNLKKKKVFLNPSSPASKDLE